MSGGPAGAGEPAALAEIAGRQNDQGFLKRLYVDGDPAAEREWQELHRRAYPEPAEAPFVTLDGGVKAPAFDAGDVPPGPRHYSFPPSLDASLEPAFRSAAHAARLGITEAADLAAAYVEAEQVVGSLRTDDDDQSLVDFTRQRLGADGIAAARKGFDHLRRAAPAFADRLEESGSTNHPRLVEAFARIGRRLR